MVFDFIFYCMSMHTLYWTSFNSCDRSQRQNSVAATVIFTCHTRRFVAVTCRGDVSQRFVAGIVCLSPNDGIWFFEKLPLDRTTNRKDDTTYRNQIFVMNATLHFWLVGSNCQLLTKYSFQKKHHNKKASHFDESSTFSKCWHLSDLTYPEGTVYILQLLWKKSWKMFPLDTVEVYKNSCHC